ncbi:MAG: 3D domain-containing protein [Candidatus Brennerbacteria bacterium]|nr:3D domain-containing protein [Candidatus Brennerbacteria bacterium]
MKRAIFFGITRISLSFILVSIGVITPIRGLFPTIAIADDRPPYRTVEVILTAYSSSPDETDETPYTTAYGTETRDGVLANNCLPFGTQVQIPEVFGDKTFIVEDRKHSRYSCSWMDIWYPSKEEAKKFGIAREVEVIVFD